MLRVLIACESSGVVREAFRARGHSAWSCDLLPAVDGSPYHVQGDVRDVLALKGQKFREFFGIPPGQGVDKFDLMIAHPMCRYLCSSGMHWTTRGLRDPQLTEDALDFVRMLMDADVERIAIENPVGCISTRIRKPDQYIQPHEHGHDASKKTGLWLKNLPMLKPTAIVAPRMVNGKPRWANQTDSGQNRLGPSPDRWQKRSETYAGIARAMAEQWG